MTKLLLVASAGLVSISFADQPYAPSRDYDLTHARIELRFDVEQRKVMGQVTHTLSALRDGLSQLNFDSVDLNISAVQVDGKDAHFFNNAENLHGLSTQQGRPEV
jgi:aminopeptidase N